LEGWLLSIAVFADMVLAYLRVVSSNWRRYF